MINSFIIWKMRTRYNSYQLKSPLIAFFSTLFTMIKYQTKIYIIGNRNRKNIFFISNNKINIDKIGNITPSQLYLILKFPECHEFISFLKVIMRNKLPLCIIDELNLSLINKVIIFNFIRHIFRIF